MSGLFESIFRRRPPVILQAERTECGLACLAMVASYHGFEHDLSSLRSRLAPSMRGVTLNQLMQMASELHLAPRALRAEPASLQAVTLPCILHWDMDHFVVLERLQGRGAVILDPAVGRLRMPLSELSKHFTGVVLELAPAPDFKREVARSQLTLGAFFSSVTGLSSALVRLLVFTFALQMFALLMPFYGQLVLDEAVSAADTNLLTLLAFSFGMLALLNMTVATVRATFVLYLGSRLQFSWASRLFHHLLRLPLAFFEKRHMADTLSRFKSLSAIQGLVTGTMVEAVIDGLMTVTTLIVLFAYSPTLATLPIVALALYLVVRCLLFRPQREASNETLMQAAKESGHFLESLRGILAIKSFAREQVRESSWQNLAAASIKTQLKATGFSTAEQLINQLLFTLEHVLVIWLGAKFIIDGSFSVGMLVAFLAYKTQFTSRASALIDKAMEFRLVSIHLDRLSDIALTDPEQSDDLSGSALPELQGGLDLHDVSFRYSPTDPYVLKNLNLSIAPGECLAIVAPSGTGKTTLLKIMMGLLRPETGQVLVDGRNVNQGYAKAFRSQVASVMQEDSLLSGALADNIAFFDPKVDMERVKHCAEVACIHDDISKMPMGYYSLVGDMGATLSGGQKQRILLARALYANPRILFLDEATSHLDAETERRIHVSLAALNITRVIIAHRKETLAIAERVVRLDQISGVRKQATEMVTAA